ncbi:MAG: hypothetical protein AAF936_01475 [Pseudomonadota bacterium]
MNRDRTFFALGGIAAVTTAATTFLLWWLPQQYSSPTTIEETMALHATAPYMARLWVNYIHVFLALFAYAAAAWAVRLQAPIAATVGFVAFLFWCLAEAIGVSINIWAVNGDWRAAYGAADEAERELIRASIHTFQGLWNGIFFVVLTTFLIGTMSYAVALFRKSALQKTLAILFFLAAPLTIIIIADGYFGASLSHWIEWSYPVLQPVSRALLGLWLILTAIKPPTLRT